MKNLLLLVFFIATPILLIKSMEAGPAPELRPAVWVNPPAAKSLAELDGEVVLVEFWATWCPPCRQSMPHLDQIHRRYKGRGLKVMSISDEPVDVVRDFVRRHKLSFPIAAECISAQDYGVKGIPRAFLVGRDGDIVWEGHPMDPAMEVAIQDELAN